MSKKNIDENSKLLYERCTDYVFSGYRSSKKAVWHTGGGFFKAMYFAFYVSCAWTLLYHAVFFLSRLFEYLDYRDIYNQVANATTKGDALNYLRITVMSIILLVASVVVARLLKSAKGVTAALILASLSVAPMVPVYILTYGVDRLSYSPGKVFLRHIIPMALVIVTMLYIFIIKLAERVTINRRCDKVMLDIYSRNGIDGMISQSDWNRYIREYLFPAPAEKLKRSKKNRERKQSGKETFSDETGYFGYRVVKFEGYSAKYISDGADYSAAFTVEIGTRDVRFNMNDGYAGFGTLGEFVDEQAEKSIRTKLSSKFGEAIFNGELKDGQKDAVCTGCSVMFFFEKRGASVYCVAVSHDRPSPDRDRLRLLGIFRMVK